MSEYILLARQLLKLGSIMAHRLKKTDPEKRKEAIMEFDKALAKAQDSEKASTKELEDWFTNHL